MTTEATGQANVHAISCTSCGAPINLFGGHKVQSIVCASCGASLDAKDEYKLIEQFIRMKRPNTTIKIGMTGTFKGVEFTVIGIVRWLERADDGTYQSYDFQLFSPTHGYAWLRREELHYLFVHEVKDMPNRHINIGAAKGTRIKARDISFSVIESGTETINYIEGELTWVARLGDKARYMTCAKPPYLYEISEMNGEREYAYGEYMEAAEVYKAFNIKEKPLRPIGVHPCQVYKSNSFIRTTFHATWFALLCLVITILLLHFGRGKTILSEVVPANSYVAGVATRTFKVSNARHLIALKLYCPFDNAWGVFDVSVRKGGNDYFTMSKEIAYYHGTDGGESWSEGKQSASAYFRVPEPGEYTLYIWGEGGSGEGKSTKLQKQPLQVKIKEGVIVSRYFIIATIVFMLIAAIGVWHRIKYEMDRRGIEIEFETD